jgi:hypothetical protein
MVDPLRYHGISFGGLLLITIVETHPGPWTACGTHTLDRTPEGQENLVARNWVSPNSELIPSIICFLWICPSFLGGDWGRRTPCINITTVKIDLFLIVSLFFFQKWVTIGKKLQNWSLDCEGIIKVLYVEFRIKDRFIHATNCVDKP